MTEEEKRLQQASNGTIPWKKWGPYLSERQWGTVREDLSASGDAWNSFSHDHARSRAYRWGEDGLAGISDDKQTLCFSLALWNRQDPIIKERMFGLTNSEGNHGEDVKEYYYYLDNTPTHTYMKYLYKYPQSAYPYDDLVLSSRHLGKKDFEYELINTGIFNDDRYFDVFVEYAKSSPETILINLSIHNRGPDPANLDVLPTLWFRNQEHWKDAAERPVIDKLEDSEAGVAIRARDKRLGDFVLWGEKAEGALFTENETNSLRIFATHNPSAYVKDAINNYIVHGSHDAVNPHNFGTKASLQYSVRLDGGESRTIRLILGPINSDHHSVVGLMDEFDTLLHKRAEEADAFYAKITPNSLTADEAMVMRQALAGMLWSKQFYYYDVDRWLEDRADVLSGVGGHVPTRNSHWQHMYNGDVLSMPDKWEYPWYAAWDLAFHVIALTMVDTAFGKEQLNLMLQGRYMHPNGQIPAYEWNFSDVNPPVQAWSTIFTYRLEKAQKGVGDITWLKTSFNKLLLNFTWWVGNPPCNWLRSKVEFPLNGGST